MDEAYSYRIETTDAMALMNPLSHILDRRYEGRVTLLALISLGLIERLDDGWQLTEAGRFAFFK